METPFLFQRHSKEDPIATTIYNVYKAKRNAEVSIGVGKETDLLILTKKGVIETDKTLMDRLSIVYDTELKYGKTDAKVYEIVDSIMEVEEQCS